MGFEFDLVIATQNKGKLKEIKECLNGLEVNLTCLADYPGMSEVIEDGDSFEANAKKKAIAVAKYAQKIALADDSGLEVDYLNGLPGVKSARFGGEGLTAAQRSQKVLKLLEGVPMGKRTARFKVVMAIAQPDKKVVVVEGECEGAISLEPRGESGFGYDPIFIPAGFSKTFAELGLEVKNRLSHRAKALQKAKEVLVKQIKQK